MIPETITVNNDTFLYFPLLPDDVKLHILSSYFSYEDKAFFYVSRIFRAIFLGKREPFFKDLAMKLFPYLKPKDAEVKVIKSSEEDKFNAIFSKIQRELNEAFGETISEKEWLLAFKEEKMLSNKKLLVVALNQSYRVRKENIPEISGNKSKPKHAITMRTIIADFRAAHTMEEVIEINEATFYCAVLRKDVKQMERLNRVVFSRGKKLALEKAEECSHEETIKFLSDWDPKPKLKI